MRTTSPKWIFLGAVLLAMPLWAAERTGELLPYTAPKEAKQIKKEQDDIMARLISGNKHHMKNVVRKPGEPKIMIVSCADSRVSPETVFNMKPGELFTNRAFGNIVDKVILASLEYGAEKLNCRVLVVMGHTGCTALKDAIAERAHPRTEWRSLNQQALNEQLQPGIAEVEESQRRSAAQLGTQLEGDELLEAVVKNNVLSTMHTIREQSPLIWDLEQKDLIKIVGCVYHLDTGKVEWLKD